MLMCPLNNKKSDSENNAANVLNFSDFNFRNSFVLILFLLLSNFGFAQVSNYSFSEGSTTYSAISGGTAPFSSNWDDNVSANNIGLGFTFNFNGTNYTTCSINSNGFITFGTTTSSSSEYSPISSGTGYAGAISALGVNLVNGGNGSSITYRTIGSAPNRVFVVQWTDIERSARGGDFNFQIRLTETSNVVSIVYGSCDPSNNSNVNVQVGLRGNTNNDYNNRSLSSTTNWAQSTTAGNANNATVRTRNNAYPDTNLLYTWAPAVACTAPNSQPSALTLTDITNNSINGSFTASSPAPDNYLVIANTTGTAPTINNGTNYTIGQDLGSTNIVIDNDGNTTFSATGLSANTKYYFFVYSYNSNCTGGTKYRTTSPLTGNATTLVYCTATSSSSSYYISSYRTTGAVIDAVNNNSGYSPSGYGDFTSLSAVQQIAGGDINISVVLTGPDKQNLRAWVDWNKNNNFDSGEIVYASNNKLSSTTFGFVIPTGTTPGNYRIRLRSGNVNGSSLTSCSNTSNGETEDYIITVIADCPAKIVSAPTVESCGVGPVTLTVTGSAGVTSYRWYNFESGGTPIAGATSSSYTTPSLNMTTTYYVTALNGSCESLVRRPITAKIKPVPNITITPSSPEICGDNNFVQISATGSTEVVELLNENFEGSGLGSFTKSGTGTSSVTEWQQKNSIYTTTTDNWKPAINSGTGTTGGNKFAFATADVDNTAKSIILTSTSSFNTTSFLDLTLTFRQYYSYYGNGESANIEVSKDNGVTWINVINNTSSQGAPSKFVTTIVYLNDYIGVPNLKFRFRYQAAFCDGWAIDDVVLSGTRPLTSNFTWTGATIDAYIDANGVTPYTNQAVNTVYIKPSTAQLEVSNWSFTANVLLSNGCTASKPVSVTNKSKVWQGNNGNWNDPNNWLPVGVPTSDNCVIIKPASSYSTINGTNYEAQAKTLTVRANARLEVPANNGIKVVNKIEVQNNGTLNLDNNASIVQVDNVANSGNVNIRRTTKPMYRYDFTYWNSPVTQASNFTLSMLSPNTLADKYMKWQPTINGGYGNWVSVNATTTAMDPRMGYIVRAPQTFDLNPSNKTPYTTTFVGTPNNGDISIPIAVGTDANVGGGVTADDDQWNLIGNPYASAIDVVSFLTDNTNKTLMDGTVYIWTHNTPISSNTPSPFYGTYAFNYTAADYATVNKFGATATAASGGNTPTQYIASGQSFFVKGLANGNARFINTMRVTGKNNNFMKNGNSTKDNPETQSVAGADSESHRIWLNLANESGAFSQILVGYDSDATMDFDRGLDGQSFGGNGVTFYSTIPNMNLTIQARPLPFNVQDQIPLGFNANAQNTYQIGIDHLDGMFDTHAIYLEDKTTNTIHDLRTAPYSFTSAAGTFDNRFVLRFNNGTLGNGDFSLENGIKVLRGGELAVNSTTERIKNITAFDVLGRKIDEYKNVNENEIVLKNVKKSSSVVLLKITLENGATVDRKTIF